MIARPAASAVAPAKIPIASGVRAARSTVPILALLAAVCGLFVFASCGQVQFADGAAAPSIPAEPEVPLALPEVPVEAPLALPEVPTEAFGPVATIHPVQIWQPPASRPVRIGNGALVSVHIVYGYTSIEPTCSRAYTPLYDVIPVALRLIGDVRDSLRIVDVLCILLCVLVMRSHNSLMKSMKTVQVGETKTVTETVSVTKTVTTTKPPPPPPPPPPAASKPKFTRAAKPAAKKEAEKKIDMVDELKSSKMFLRMKMAKEEIVTSVGAK